MEKVAKIVVVIDSRTFVIEGDLPKCLHSNYGIDEEQQDDKQKNVRQSLSSKFTHTHTHGFERWAR